MQQLRERGRGAILLYELRPLLVRRQLAQHAGRHSLDVLYLVVEELPKNDNQRVTATLTDYITYKLIRSLIEMRNNTRVTATGYCDKLKLFYTEQSAISMMKDSTTYKNHSLQLSCKTSALK